MRKQVLVTVDRGETRVGILEAEGEPRASASANEEKSSSRRRRDRRGGPSPRDGRVAELYIERRGNRSLVGNIYKGRVMRVLPGMQSAFVDIGLERDAFLYVSDFFDEEEEFERIVVDNKKTEGADAATAARAAAEKIVEYLAEKRLI